MVGVVTTPPAAAAAATAAAAAELDVWIVSPGLMTLAAPGPPPERTTGGPPSEVVICSCGGLAMKRLVFGAVSEAANGCGMTLATGRLAVPLFGMYGGSDIVLAPPAVATGSVVTVVTGPVTGDAFWMLTVEPTTPPAPPTLWTLDEIGTLINLVAPTVDVGAAVAAVRILAGVALSGTGFPAPPVTATGFSVTLTCWPNGTDGMTVILLDGLRPMRT